MTDQVALPTSDVSSTHTDVTVSQEHSLNSTTQETSKQEQSPAEEISTGNDKDQKQDFTTYYNDTGIKPVDSILSDLKASKIPAEKAAAIFDPVLESMDISKLDMVALEKAVGKVKADSIRDRAELFIIKEKASRDDFSKEINTLTDNNWDSIKEWAKSKFSDSEREELNQLLLAGGLQRKMAASFLTQQYKDATSVVPGKETAYQVADRALIKPTTTSTADAPMTAEEYKKARAELPRKAGMLTLEGQKLSEQLDARRRAAIRLGC